MSVSDEQFEGLVRDALDELPQEAIDGLKNVAVTVSNDGIKRHLYGLYSGDGVARDNYPDTITIFSDTLIRDFGKDPERLRAEVRRTVRHEVAHHLGWGEAGVQKLGL